MAISPKETLVGATWVTAFGHKRSLSTGNKHAFHRIDGERFDVLVKAWFSGAKMNNAMSKA
jgi:hypothetical protein